MNVCLIRHSKTKGNLRKAYIGSTDEDILEFSVSDDNKKLYPLADCVFSSPLKRCRRTAEIIYPNALIVTEENLRECDFGEFENKNFDDLKNNKNYQKWIDSNGITPFHGGEDGTDFRNRCVTAFLNVLEISEKKNYNNISIVAHGGTIMAILEHFYKPHKAFYCWQAENLNGFKFTICPTTKNIHHLEKLF